MMDRKSPQFVLFKDFIEQPREVNSSPHYWIRLFQVHFLEVRILLTMLCMAVIINSGWLA